MRSLPALFSQLSLIAIWGGFCLISLPICISFLIHGQIWFAVLCFAGCVVSIAGLIRGWGWAVPLTALGGALGIACGNPAMTPASPEGLLVGTIVGLMLGAYLDYILAEQQPANDALDKERTADPRS